MREFKESITAKSNDGDDDSSTLTEAARSDDPAQPDDAVSRPRG